MGFDTCVCVWVIAFPVKMWNIAITEENSLMLISFCSQSHSHRHYSYFYKYKLVLFILELYINEIIAYVPSWGWFPSLNMVLLIHHVIACICSSFLIFADGELHHMDTPYFDCSFTCSRKFQLLPVWAYYGKKFHQYLHINLCVHTFFNLTQVNN